MPIPSVPWPPMDHAHNLKWNVFNKVVVDGIRVVESIIAAAYATDVKHVPIPMALRLTTVHATNKKM